MPGKLIDYGIERQRHDGFVGREALLERLDELLTADGADRWVVVTGGPGIGKSALLAAWLARRERAGAVVPHHFIRRGQYDWGDPAKPVGSLVAQLEERHPGVCEPEADARIHPAARLAAMLARVSASEPARRGERLVILIDGLDEYDPPAGAAVIDPLAAFLPHALPHGVSFLCASRPRHPYMDRLAERDGELVQLDLDEPDFAADNEATVRAFWERAAPALGLDARFVDEAVARAGGNLQHAATLRKQLAGLPAEQRRAVDIPRGLSALIAKSWQRVATDPIAVGGLGILCAARGALTLDELDAVAGWTDEAQRQASVRGARELVVETRRTDAVPEYRLHHDSIRAHIAGAIGATTLRGHHSALARQHATWPAPVEACAMIPDGGRVVSASDDKTLKVWALATGRTLVTLDCHAGRVTACAMIPDGGRVVSASGDNTLKVWELESVDCQFTHRANAGYVTVAATATAIIASDDFGSLWFIDWPLTDHRERPPRRDDGHDPQRSLSRGTESLSPRPLMKKHTMSDGQTFDVFLSHNSHDKPAVRRLKDMLGEHELAVWLDEDQLQPGLPWQRLLEIGIKNSRSAAVLVGKDGLGPWENEEVQAALLLAVRNGRPVIPVLLPGSAAPPELPLFLANRTWVDLRDGFTDEGMAKLIWGITGNKTRSKPESADPQPSFSNRKNLERTAYAPSEHAELECSYDWYNEIGFRNSSELQPGVQVLYEEHALFPELDEQYAKRLRRIRIPEHPYQVSPRGFIKISKSDWEWHDPRDRSRRIHDAVIHAVPSPTEVAFHERHSVGIQIIVDILSATQRREELAAPSLLEPQGSQTGAGSAPAGTAPASQPSRPGASTAAPPKVDIGILTIRDDEFRAVLDMFPSEAGIAEGKNRKYPLRRADIGNGQQYTIAVLRQVRQGNGEAQNAARDIIEDLAPKLVLVVGIAGGLPSDDVKLGDVVISTQIQDFTVEARKYGKETTYAVKAGPVVKSLATDVAILAARGNELGNWTAALPSQPEVKWRRKGQLYGPSEWQSELRAKLEHHYGTGSTPRAPVFVAGPIASSDRLVKDPDLVIAWLATSRDLLAIEMESGGVYYAAQDRCPMLAIRGISDIVGLVRADAWTTYACASAAAFTRAFLRTRPVEVSASVDVAAFPGGANKAPEEIRKPSSP